ncbi:MAG: hypothetical protein ISR65_09975 [Bacteriovoracaceae bacterium]|nr:hypothetical protein [Bacteriovoracaceae bacterium]
MKRRTFWHILIFLIIIILYAPLTFAEYRAYQYYVRSKLNLVKKSRPFLIVSTLDPVTYLAYHGGSESIDIDLLRTWVCAGYTGKQKICKSPYKSFNLPGTPSKI